MKFYPIRCSDCIKSTSVEADEYDKLRRLKSHLWHVTEFVVFCPLCHWQLLVVSRHGISNGGDAVSTAWHEVKVTGLGLPLDEEGL